MRFVRPLLYHDTNVVIFVTHCALQGGGYISVQMFLSM